MGSSLHNQRDAPANGAFAVTTSDSTDLPRAIRGFYVGGAGDVKVTTLDSTVVTFVAVPVGQIMPVSCDRIWQNGTTATSIVGLY